VDVKSIGVFREAVRRLRVASNVYTPWVVGIRILVEAYERLLQFRDVPIIVADHVMSL
jgi:hypothetical protein